MAGGGAGGDAPDAQALALGLPYAQPQPPKRLAHHGIQRITVEFSEKSRRELRCCVSKRLSYINVPEIAF